MPISDIIIPEVTKQCIEPVAEQFINQILEYLNIRSLFTSDNLFIDSDDLKASKFDNALNDSRIQDNRCDVAIVPGYNPLETPFDATKGKDLDVHVATKRWTFDDYPVFQDSRAMINLFEVATPSPIELRFAIKVKSIELSDAINTMLFSRYLTGGSVYDYSDIHFAYAIPDTFILMLYRMYHMQDDISSAMTFQQYLSTGSNSAITMLVNRDRLADGSGELIIQREHTRVLGRMDYAGDKHSTEDVNKVSNRYVIEFAYTFQFAKPMMLRMSYPIMVNNKQVPGVFTGRQTSMRYGEGKQVYPNRSINDYLFAKNRAQIDLDLAYPHVQYPHYDDWSRSPAMYHDIITKYQTLFTGLMTINTEPENSLSVDLANEVFPMLDPLAVEEIKRVIPVMNLDPEISTFGDMFRRSGIFDIAVFSNDTLISFNDLSLSSDGGFASGLWVLTVNAPLSKSKLYRVVISQIREIRILNREYIYYMLDHPEYYKAFIAFHMDYLCENKYVRLISDSFVDSKSVEIGRRNLQTSYGNLTPRAITIHNYVIEVIKNR